MRVYACITVVWSLAAEDLADVVQAHAGQLAYQIHGDLAGQRDLLGSRTADDVVERQIEVLRHLRDDVRGLDFHVGGEEVLQSLLRKARVTGWLLSDAMAVTRFSAPSSSRMFSVKRSAIRLNTSLGILEPFMEGDHAQNGDSRLQIRRLDVHGQAGFEAGDESFVEALQVLRRHIGGDHDTLVGLMQGVERVEELFEGRVLAARGTGYRR
jgi:hypothetical protein